MNRFPFKIGVKLIALFVIYLGSCTKLQNALVQVDNTNAILAKAVQSLNDQSISWQATLTNAQNQLTSDLQSTIRNEISDMITRSTAAAGSEVKCIGDFLRERLKKELNRLIEVHKCDGSSTTVPKLVPYFCTVVPSSIDMVLSPDRRNKIDFYGFDFDRAQKIKIVVLNASNQVIADGTQHLSVVTHYQMVLNLSTTNGLTLSNQASYIVLYFGATEISRIPVRQPAPPPQCTNRMIELQPRSTNYAWKPPTLPDNRSGADDRFICGRMNFRAMVSLRLVGNEVRARVYVYAKECCDDGWDLFNNNCHCFGICESTAEGWSPEQTIYVAPTTPNTTLQRILSQTSYSTPLTYLSGTNKSAPNDTAQQLISAGGDTPVFSIQCNSNNQGVTAVINWKSIRVEACQL